MPPLPEFVEPVLAFIKEHQNWAIPIVFALAFGESLAFISLLLPATVILVSTGALIGATGIPFWPIWLAAGMGAALGDWLSYWLGYHYHEPISRMWPLSRHPDLLPRGQAFFDKWGIAGIFIGRFFGPLRAIVPLVAGACKMPFVLFQLANWSSAFLWGAWTLGAGALGVEGVQKFIQ